MGEKGSSRRGAKTTTGHADVTDLYGLSLIERGVVLV